MADNQANLVTEVQPENQNIEQAQPQNDEMAKLKKDLSEFKSKAREYETLMKTQKENELKQKDEWQKYAQMKEAEAGEFKNKYEALQNSLIIDKKYNALKDHAVKLGLRHEAIPDLELVDLSDIQVETTSTGKFNIIGADKFADRLKAIRPHWFGGNTVNVNTGSPRVEVGGKVTPQMIYEAEKEGRKSGDLSKYHDLFKRYRSQK